MRSNRRYCRNLQKLGVLCGRSFGRLSERLDAAIWLVSHKLTGIPRISGWCRRLRALIRGQPIKLPRQGLLNRRAAFLP
jgi:hypothetical protein